MTTLPNSKRLGAALLLAAPLLGACDEGLEPTFEDKPVALSVYLKDAPGDVDSVWIQLDDIVLVGDAGTLSLLEEPTGLLNVTALRDSTVALVEGLETDTATYHEIRLVLGGAVLQTEDGSVYTLGSAQHPHGLQANGTLVCPSCTQSGIKVKLHGALGLDEGENGLLLDFDVSQSFGRQAGASGRWVMHPVVHAELDEPEDIEDDEGNGEIEGVALLAEGVSVPTCGGAERTLESLVPTATSATLVDDEGAPLMFTGEVEAEDDGAYEAEIDVLAPSTYQLGFLAETVFETEKLVWEATVEPAEVALNGADAEVEGVTWTVTAVRCETVTP